MDRDDASESIPLLTLETLHNSNIRDLNASRVTSTLYDDDDGAVPAPIFLSEKHLYKTPPVFTPVRLKWTHAVAHKVIRFPLTPLLVVLTAAIAHGSLIGRLRHDSSIHRLNWSPAAIATCMAMTTIWLSLRQRELQYQNLQTQRAESYWRRARMGVVICIIAPLLAIPIFDSTYVVEDKASMGNKTYATLSSWSQSIANLKASVPSFAQDLTITPSNPWTVTDSAVRKAMPIPITFPLALNGRGRREKIWNEEEADINGVYMPVLPLPHDALIPESVFETTLQATTQILAMQLVCEFMEVESSNVQINDIGESTLVVQVRDQYACGGTVRLGGIELEDGMRDRVATALERWELPSSNEKARLDWKELLREVIVGHLERAKLNEKAGIFIEDYLTLLRNPTPATVFSPAWSRLFATNSSTDENLCTNRLAIVGLSQPFQAKGITPNASLFEAASCKPWFTGVNTNLTFRKSREMSLRDPDVLTSRGSYIGKFSIPEKVDTEWKPLEADQFASLSNAFFADAAASAIRGKAWPWDLMNAGLGDLLYNRERPVGSILLAGAQVRQSFIVSLATAAELTLREELALGGPGMRLGVVEEQSLSHLEREIFQTKTTFRFFLWFGVFIFALLVFAEIIVSSAAESFAGFMSYLLNTLRLGTAEYHGNLSPWPLTSPAAKALLLRDSSALSYLYELHTGYRKLTELPDLRIGHWAVHQTVGKTGWRLDTADVHGISKGKSHKKQDLDPKLTDDDFAMVMFIPSGLYVSLAILTYIILQSIAIAKAANSSQPLESLLELRRILGVVDMGPRTPFWSLVFWWRILPASLIFSCTLMWMPAIYHFFRGRQPWVAMLRAPQPAEKSITLDYSIQWFPLYHAICNRHWLIATLALGNLGMILVPSMQVNLLSVWEVRELPSESISGPVNKLNWTEELQHPTGLDQSTFDSALWSLSKSFSSQETWATWSISGVTLLPLDLEGLDLHGYSYFAYDTMALRSALICEEVTVDLVTRRSAPGGDSSYLIDHLSISQGVGAASSPIRMSAPCAVPGSVSSINQTGPANQFGSKQVTCVRWYLDDSGAENTSDDTRWVITTIRGTGSWSVNHQDMEFFDAPSAIGTLCSSSLVKEFGTATISTGPVFGAPTPVQYEASSCASNFDSQIIAALNRGLNISNTRFNNFDGGIVASENMVHTDRFAGDFLSWIMYQHAYASCPSCLNSSRLSRDASQLFTAYVAALAAQKDTALLVDSAATSTLVELRPRKFGAGISVNWSAAVFQFLYVILCLGILSIFPKSYKKYSLPFSPESLLNSIILFTSGGGKKEDLEQRSILYWMENKLSSRKKMDLRKIYKEIESWGLRYMLVPVDVPADESESIRLAVEVVSPAEEDGATERYHDVVEGGDYCPWNREGRIRLDDTNTNIEMEADNTNEDRRERDQGKDIWLSRYIRAAKDGRRVGRAFAKFSLRWIVPAVVFPLRKTIEVCDQVAQYSRQAELRRLQRHRAVVNNDLEYILG